MIKVNVTKNCIGASVLPKAIEINNENLKVVKGDKGAVFIPHVDEECNLSWTNDGDLPNPPTVNIKGENGDATVTPIPNLEIEAILRR